MIPPPARFLTLALILLYSTVSAFAQEAMDYTALGEPSFANRLTLTDEQRAAVAKILDERVQKLVAAKPGERAQVLADSNRALEQLLSAEQKATFAVLATGGKLRFSFRQQKWPDVLDWFAKQSDLSLVMDTSPPGLFTYSDSKEYTPSEAIDLLNSVLLSKGFTLMRREQMLIVVDTAEGIPFEMAPRVSVEQLASRGRFEIVTVEFPLEGRPVDACLNAVKDLIGKHGRATPLSTAGKLIVTETAGKLSAINEVIAAIPIPKPAEAPAKPPEPVFAVYPAKGLDPLATVATLQGLFPTATIKADPTAEEIHAFAIPAVQTAIQTSVEKMTANVSGDKRPRLHIYPVDAKNLSQLRSQLEQTVPDAKVTVDEGQQRLLVVADTETHAEVQATLEKLGAAGPAEAASVITVYTVPGGLTDSLLNLVTQVVPRAFVVSHSGRIVVRGTPDEQKTVQATIEQFRPAEQPTLRFYPLEQPLDSSLLSTIQASVPGATVSLLEGGKRLSVLATAEAHSLVEAVLANIATNLPSPADRTLEIYRSERLPITDLQTLLASVAPEAKIRADLSGKRLVVWGTAEEHKSISSTLQRVAADLQGEQSSLETYDVPETESAAILAAAQALAPNSQSRLDSTNRRLIVIGSAPDQQLVRELVRKLAPADDASQKVLIAYPLERADAEALVEVLQGLRPDIRVSADKRANRVLVTALLREQPRLEAIISQLDAAPDARQEEMVKPYRLQTLNPQIVVALLQPLVPKMRLSVDPAAKQLLASGTESDHQKLERTIAKIDGEEGAASVVQSYDIGTADSTQVRDVLLQLVPGAVASANPAARQLMVWATTAQHSLIKQAIDQFTRQEPGQGRQLRTYRLPKTVSATMVTMLRPVAPDALLSLDPSGEQIIVWATPKDQQAVQAAIQEVEQNLPQRPGTVLRVYPLKDRRITAQTVKESLDAELTENASILVNAPTNSLIVRASEPVHQRLQQAIAALGEQLPPESSLNTQIFRFQRGSPSGALSVLRSLVPAASLAADDPARTLAATASEEDLRRITAVVEQMEAADPAAHFETHIYRFNKITAQAAQAAFQQLAPQARLAHDDNARVVIATASDADHRLFRDTATELDGQPVGSITRVYPLDANRIGATEVVEAMDNELKASVAIQVNKPVNSLIVRGTEQAHAQVQESIDAIVKQLPQPPAKSTRVYPLKTASAQVVQQSLQTLLERGSVVGDEASSSLLVTGTDVEHERVAAVIEKLDSVPSQKPVVRAYPIRNRDADAVYRAISEAYGRSGDVSVTYQSATRTLLVVASPRNQAILEELIGELDQPGMPHQPRTAKVYSLANVDGKVAAASLNMLFKDQEVEVQYNAAGNALVVVATADQHQAVEQSLRQMEGIERSLEIFTLRNTDPFVVENAIGELFATDAEAAAPSVSSDYDTQRLFVRGTQPQIEQIRKLLESLGETVADASDVRLSGEVRSIPFPGDTREAARQIEAIWARLRPNRIHVITPAQQNLTPRRPAQTPQEGSPSPGPGNPPRDDSKSSAVPGSSPTQLVAWQQTTRKPEPVGRGVAPPATPQPGADPQQASEPGKAREQEPPTETQEQKEKEKDKDKENPPVVVIPEDGRITIASPDQEALDRLESLLRAMARSDATSGGSNFSVYLLQNTGAVEMQQLLKQLFDELPVTRSSVGRVVVVADERLNALIVHGTHKDRDLVEELLQVLDTSELPGPLAVPRPSLIPVKNTDARRVLTILENVYKTQLTSGGGRKPVQIPKGISSDVANVLQQINAAAAGPLLTLDVDETTNSIVMRAPPELHDEIRGFVEQLDEQANQKPNRSVRVIRLEGAKSDQVRAVLQDFLLRSPNPNQRRN